MTVEGAVAGEKARSARTEEFRDRLGIVTEEGKRKRIYPRRPKGRFHTARVILSWALLAVLFVTPFLRIGGHPVMLFDITERKFIVFGMIFGPHDFLILALATITVIVFIFLFTVVFGRLFCGWVCPQTVLLEMVFRKIDYWLEGNHVEQARLNAAPWTGRKLRIKALKHGIYFLLSFVIANTLLAWIIGTDKLLAIIADPPSAHMAGLTAILVFTAGFHWLFAWFREQACILVCPYGRLQGVMLDRSSVVIAYDFKRGEPRALFRKNEARTAGDCIACNQCVEVCPTGIDIRNGTQLECVNCTACIDACDTVMDAVKKPRGLIRYDSFEGIERGVRRLLTPRSIGYSAVLAVLMGFLVWRVAARADVDVTLLRTPGMFYQELPDGRVANLYDVKAVNKTFERMPISFRLRGREGNVTVLGDPLVLNVQEATGTKLMVTLPREEVRAMSTPLTVDMYAGERLVASAATSFLGPVETESP
jgi:cytochrome c oxidase accessory protein FixG